MKCQRDELGAPDPFPNTLYYIEMYNLCSLMNIPPVKGGIEDQDAKMMEAFMIIRRHVNSKKKVDDGS